MSAVLAAAIVWCNIGMLPPPEAPDRDPQPVPKAKVERIVLPPTSSGRGVKGWATYYAYHEGQAAAGPGLRKLLGPKWRDDRVNVCKGDTCISVRLTDWCACGDRHGDPTIIDLDKRDFAKLASLGAGIVMVRASR